MSKVINDVSFKLETNVNELPSHTAADEGKVLTVGEHNELEWAEGGTGGVTSVNGQTGVVVLESSDIGDDSSVGGDTIALSLNALKSAIDDIDVPVTSVNGKEGDVVIDATDVKLTTTQTTVQANIQRIDEELNRIEGEIPTKVSDLTNDEGFSVVSGANDGTNWTSITIDGTTKDIPSGGGDVESVNGQTGVVVLDAGDLMFDDENTVEQAITDNTNYIEAVADDVVDNTTAINALQSSKQDTLTAGTGIDITNNVISATGGGSVEIDGLTIVTNSDGELETAIGGGGDISWDYDNPITFDFEGVSIATSPADYAYKYIGSNISSSITYENIKYKWEALDGTTVIDDSWRDCESFEIVKNTVIPKTEFVTNLEIKVGSDDPEAFVTRKPSVSFNVISVYSTKRSSLNDRGAQLGDVTKLRLSIALNTSDFEYIKTKYIPIDNSTIEVKDGLISTSIGGNVKMGDLVDTITLSYSTTNAMYQKQGRLSYSGPHFVVWDDGHNGQYVSPEPIFINNGPYISAATNKEDILIKLTGDTDYTIMTGKATGTSVTGYAGYYKSTGTSLITNVDPLILKVYKVVSEPINASAIAISAPLRKIDGSGDNVTPTSIGLNYDSNFTLTSNKLSLNSSVTNRLIPVAPTVEEGTFLLMCSVVSGVPTFSWATWE